MRQKVVTPTRKRDILSHWLWAAAGIFMLAALCIPQLDDYPLSMDSMHSYSFAFGLTVDNYSPADVMERLHDLAPYQLPLHYALLHYWGALTGHSLVAARMSTTLFALLTMAMTYRLSHDFAARSAGAFAIFVMLCNAFAAYSFTQVRYYTLLPLLASIVLWLYLRVTRGAAIPRRRDWLALTLAVWALGITHVSGYIFFIALGLYHLLFARKDRRWLQVAACVAAAMLLALPALLQTLTDGATVVLTKHEARDDSVLPVLASWLSVSFNGFPPLLMIPLSGLLIGWRRGLPHFRFLLVMPPLLLLALALATAPIDLMTPGKMRYMLVATPVIWMATGAGLYALNRLRRWLGLLALLWMASSVVYTETADWQAIIENNTYSWSHPPWHLISRWMLESGERLPALAFEVNTRILDRKTTERQHMKIYYFKRHGLEIAASAPDEIADIAARRLFETPGYWIIYQRDNINPATLAAIDAEMDAQGYEHCQDTDFTNQTVVAAYRWQSVECRSQPQSVYTTDMGDYEALGVAHDESARRLQFVGRWQAADPGATAALNLSFQLLDADWRSHAQIDLATEHASEMRQFVFDLSLVPPGDYRLVAIVYNAQTFERLGWHDNDGWIPEMRKLADIVIADDTA